MELDSIHSYLIERMIAVAEEIFDSVRYKIIEYEAEIDRLNQENRILRSRDCKCTETCHDTLREEDLPGPTSSKISQIQVKLEVASIVSANPRSQASSISGDIPIQDPDLGLSYLPEVTEKTEGSGASQSITVKTEMHDYQTFQSMPTTNNCQAELPIAEQYPTKSKRVQKKPAVKQKQKNVMCYICNKLCRDKGLLHEHMMVHQDVRPFSCHMCGSRFKSKSNLKEHERVHVGDYRYSCPRCGRGFSRSNHVRNHLNSSRCR